VEKLAASEQKDVLLFV